jgi:hypothetical protein
MFEAIVIFKNTSWAQGQHWLAYRSLSLKISNPGNSRSEFIVVCLRCALSRR